MTTQCIYCNAPIDPYWIGEDTNMLVCALCFKEVGDYLRRNEND